MIIKFKKTSNCAVTPTKAHESDAGFDLVAVGVTQTDKYIEYDTDICVEIPNGHVGLLFPRSSISKTDLSLANSIGVIDSGYRGSIMCRFKLIPRTTERKGMVFPSIYKTGEKIAQLIIIPIPDITFKEVSDLSDTDRGTGGFGSSGTGL